MHDATATHARPLDPPPRQCLGVAVTVHLAGDRPVFRVRVFARHCVDFLRALGTITGTRVHAYCLLPDRAEIVLGLPAATSVDGFVGRWKDLCAREWHRRTREADPWSSGFESHTLASTADLALARERVLDAPLLEGLVATRGDYSLAGTCPPP